MLHPTPPPGLDRASAPCTLQGEARHTAIKNITSVLFGICYSARVTGYKYILQRASSPLSRGGLRGRAGPGGTGASRPPARAASASRTGSRRARDGGPARTQELPPSCQTRPPSCFPTPKVPGTMLAADTLPALTGMPRVGSRAAPSLCPAALKPPPALRVPQPRHGCPVPTQAASPPVAPLRAHPGAGRQKAPSVQPAHPPSCRPAAIHSWGRNCSTAPWQGGEQMGSRAGWPWGALGRSTGCCPGWLRFSCGCPRRVTPRRGWGWHRTVLAAGWDGSRGEPWGARGQALE